MAHTLAAHRGKPSLPETIEHRMKLYSVAAAAASISVLALVQPADATVVITRKNIPLVPPVDGQILVSIDLNNDGITDFEFSANSFKSTSFNAAIAILPKSGGNVVGNPGRGISYASALMRGAKIGPSAHFSSLGSNGGAIIERSHGFGTVSRVLYGDWGGNPPNRYIGVRFLINGATHYGWVRFSVNSTKAPLSATITAYAYETVANKRILAGISPTSATEGQPQAKVQRSEAPSLGMLALGAEGLELWRRDDSITLLPKSEGQAR